jgi:4-alpha-glucanotransferase
MKSDRAIEYERSCGILLHPTSLPGEWGVGDIGPEAVRWVDFLSQTACSLWQLLPLGPTGYGDSPYQCFSAFAGNPYLISPQLLLDDGLLHHDQLADKPEFPTERVDYGAMIEWKVKILDRAYWRFQEQGSPELRNDFDKFRENQANWLDDFALFMAIKEDHDGAPWPTWELPLRRREKDALIAARRDFKEAIHRQIFRQFIFFKQWSVLRAYTNNRGIKIVGDIPIFVAHDSADVWANPELFYLDDEGSPTVVAGVPPDYFSPTGQLWGNPLYRWDVHKESGYQWWLERLRSVLSMVDIVRLDHFRGYAGYWEVPGDAETAENGHWVPGPGKHFFEQVRQALGELPIIAEDLGVITPDVVELREHFGLPGMKILQFSFEGDPSDPFLPHNYPRNCVVYTGTHDNDTALGWYQRVSEKARDFYRRYLARSGNDVSWDLIRACWSSVAVFALAPLQDFLSLGNQARMNYPGNPSGNWTWRMPADSLGGGLSARIREINYLYSRENPLTLDEEAARKAAAEREAGVIEVPAGERQDNAN